MSDDDRFGERFQQLTKYARGGLGVGARAERRPEAFKEYPGAARTSVKLEALPEGSLWEALAARRSRRTFSGAAIGRETLAQLIFAAQGATARGGGLVLRTAPSAGALFPIETYLVVNHVTDIAPGLYHYEVRRAELELMRAGAIGPELAGATLGQDMVARAAVTFIFSAIPDRSSYKYAQRAYRYLYLDAGHIGQNLYLAAEALGLGCCAIGAFLDDEVNALLNLDPRSETVIYLAAIGPVEL
jgi:SagB-type dehydrogenase family enzyme